MGKHSARGNREHRGEQAQGGEAAPAARPAPAPDPGYQAQAPRQRTGSGYQAPSGYQADGYRTGSGYPAESAGGPGGGYQAGSVGGPAAGFEAYDTGQHLLGPYGVGRFPGGHDDALQDTGELRLGPYDTGQFPTLPDPVHDTGELRLGPYDTGQFPAASETGEFRFDPFGRYDTGEYPQPQRPASPSVPHQAAPSGPAGPSSWRPGASGPAGPGGPVGVRGGHPEQREPGGGWGALGGPATAPGPATLHSPAAGPGATTSGAGTAASASGAAAASGATAAVAGGLRLPGPRQEYVEAFDALDARLRGTAAPAPEISPDAAPDFGATADVPGATADVPGVVIGAPRPAVPEPATEPARTADGAGGGRTAERHGAAKGGKGRAFTGVAAAAVTTVLAVVVAGQVAEGGKEEKAASRPHEDVERGDDRGVSRGEPRPTPTGIPAGPVSYAEKMAATYPLDPDLQGPGSFVTISGHDKAPGRGEVRRYRVDVEKGLPLDGELFAEAVHKTLNDDRSWGHGGKLTFERVSSGRVDFVITLASPGTTGKWCAKSGLDTTVDNVSCDSAATKRVMINAFRWAQGAQTFGEDRMHAYRQMLINHEAGHRLGHNHESCSRDGALAPVMMQQTKFLTTDGATCRPNPWPFPER